MTKPRSRHHGCQGLSQSQQRRVIRFQVGGSQVVVGMSCRAGTQIRLQLCSIRCRYIHTHTYVRHCWYLLISVDICWYLLIFVDMQIWTYTFSKYWFMHMMNSLIAVGIMWYFHVSIVIHDWFWINLPSEWSKSIMVAVMILHDSTLWMATRQTYNDTIYIYIYDYMFFRAVPFHVTFPWVARLLAPFQALWRGQRSRQALRNKGYVRDQSCASPWWW